MSGLLPEGFHDRLPPAADAATGLIRAPDQIRALPADTRAAVIDSIALGVSRIYWISVGLMLVAFVSALLLPEKPLRSRAGITDAMEGVSA